MKHPAHRVCSRLVQKLNVEETPISQSHIVLSTSVSGEEYYSSEKKNEHLGTQNVNVVLC